HPCNIDFVLERDRRFRWRLFPFTKFFTRLQRIDCVQALQLRLHVYDPIDSSFDCQQDGRKNLVCDNRHRVEFRWWNAQASVVLTNDGPDLTADDPLDDLDLARVIGCNADNAAIRVVHALATHTDDEQDATTLRVRA